MTWRLGAFVFLAACATSVEPDSSAIPDAPAKHDAAPDADASSSPHVADAAAPLPGPSKGLWVWGSTIRGNETAFASWLTKHAYTDAFVLIKGVSGTAKYDVLAALMNARKQAKQTFRIWAWVVGFHDESHTSSSWHYLVGSWLAPDDSVYRKHLVDVVAAAIDPARGEVSAPPDGVMLDDTFQWPSAAYGSSASYRVQTLMSTVDAIRSEVDAVSKSAKHPVLLGFAPHPETAVVSKSASSITTSAGATYGQDFGEIAKRCDWIVPETYRYGFYPEAASWIAKVVSDVRKEIELECATRAERVSVAPALVLYESDTNPAPIATTDLAADRGSAKSADGYSVFRFMSAASDGRDLPTAAQNSVLDQP
jgi:hypothetical protein